MSTKHTHNWEFIKGDFYYAEIYIDDIDIAIKCLDHFYRRYFYYRGMSNEDFLLKSTIDRVLNNINPQDCENKIRKYENEIQTTSKGIWGEIDDPFEKLAYIQHHRGKTRLIDFSYSFKIAVFFAMADLTIDANPAVYIIRDNLPHLGWKSMRDLTLDEKLNYNYQHNEELRSFKGYFDSEEINLSQEEITEEFKKGYPANMEEFHVASVSFIDEEMKRIKNEFDAKNLTTNPAGFVDLWKSIELEPERKEFINTLIKNDKKNKRMFIQEGLFLFSTNLKNNFIENLCYGYKPSVQRHRVSDMKEIGYFTHKMANAHRGVAKIVFDKKLRKIILNQLKCDGIDYNYVYPDDEGKSLQFHHNALIIDSEFEKIIPDYGIHY
jgi:hypothetical protein